MNISYWRIVSIVLGCSIILLYIANTIESESVLITSRLVNGVVNILLGSLFIWLGLNKKGAKKK